MILHTKGDALRCYRALVEASYSCCNERPLESQFVAVEEADDEAVDELGMRSQSASGPGSDSPSPEPSASYCDSARHQMVSVRFQVALAAVPSQLPHRMPTTAVPCKFCSLRDIGGPKQDAKTEAVLSSTGLPGANLLGR